MKRVASNELDAMAYERMPLVKFENTSLLVQLRGRGIKLLGCIAGTKRSIYKADLRGGVILAIGGEKRGLSGAVRGICDGLVTIPTEPGAASLPLSHAAAMVLSEANQ